MPSLTLEQWGIVVAIISGFGGFVFGAAGLGLSIYQLRESPFSYTERQGSKY